MISGAPLHVVRHANSHHRHTRITSGVALNVAIHVRNLRRHHTRIRADLRIAICALWRRYARLRVRLCAKRKTVLDAENDVVCNRVSRVKDMVGRTIHNVNVNVVQSVDDGGCHSGIKICSISVKSRIGSNDGNGGVEDARNVRNVFTTKNHLFELEFQRCV